MSKLSASDRLEKFMRDNYGSHDSAQGFTKEQIESIRCNHDNMIPIIIHHHEIAYCSKCDKCFFDGIYSPTLTEILNV